jgi:hypothetical protein
MGPSGFTSHPKEGVLRIFVALKILSPRPGLKTRPSGPVASTLTTTPPKRWLYSLANHADIKLLPTRQTIIKTKKVLLNLSKLLLDARSVSTTYLVATQPGIGRHGPVCDN